jgi:hypothetical protein
VVYSLLEQKHSNFEMFLDTIIILVETKEKSILKSILPYLFKIDITFDPVLKIVESMVL